MLRSHSSETRSSGCNWVGPPCSELPVCAGAAGPAAPAPLPRPPALSPTFRSTRRVCPGEAGNPRGCGRDSAGPRSLSNTMGAIASGDTEEGAAAPGLCPPCGVGTCVTFACLEFQAREHWLCSEERYPGLIRTFFLGKCQHSLNNEGRRHKIRGENGMVN